MQTWSKGNVVIYADQEHILFANDWLQQVTGEPEDLAIHSWLGHAESMMYYYAIRSMTITEEWFNANS